MLSDPSEPFDVDAALGALPLFPLPQAVLFPGAVLPLHIFEPRYKAMIRDCLDSHRVLAVVQITSSKSRDEHGHPQIAGVAGAGSIIDHVKLSDGRYNILLRGQVRVKIEEHTFAPPYRTARATVLETEETGVADNDITALISNATAFVSLVRERERDFELRLPSDIAPGLLADICAHHLIIDAAERQSILETLDQRARVQRVTESLALQRLALSKGDRTLN